RQRAGEQRLLGALRLRPSATIPVNGQDVCCFAVRSSRNQCLPRMRLWARYLHWAYLRWRRPPDVGMALRDIHAMPVFFICPRPVALVSVADGAAGNLFPMNLMGPLGDGRFGFALNSTRPAASLVQRAGRLALSTVPLERAAAVRGLGRNHKRESIHWQELPFPMTESGTLGLPVRC